MSEAKTSQLKGRQTSAVAPGPASNENKIILPSNSTANLAQISNDIASIAYDTDQQAIVINDGTGFQPVGGGSGGITELTGDVDASGTGSVAATVTGLQGQPVSDNVPADGDVLMWSQGDGVWEPAPSSAGSPGGNPTNIQYNGGGTFAGDNNLVWQPSGQTFVVTGAPSPTAGTVQILGGYRKIDLPTGYPSDDPNTRNWGIYTDNPAYGYFSIQRSTNNATSPSLSAIAADHTSAVYLGAAQLKFPNADGSAGQVLTTDGAGVTSWQSAGAPSGFANASAYFNGSGSLVSNPDSQFSASTFSRSDVYNLGGTVTITGEGSYVHALMTSGSSANATGRGSMIQGEIGNGGSSMTASGVGSIAAGGVFGGSQINANDGSWAHGYASNSGVISAGNTGNEASGRAENSSQISANGNGSKAMGYAIAGFNIQTGTDGAFAGGVAGSGAISANGQASISYGDDIVTSSDFGTSLGLGQVNSSYASLVMGRYASDTGSPASWVSTEPAFVIGNGTSSGSRSNALQVDKDGKVTYSAAEKNTAIRIVTTSASVSARTDKKVLLNDGAAGANTLTLPAGEDGLTFVFSAVSTNTGTWALSPSGGNTVDASVPANLALTAPPKNITFLSGKWYYI